MEGRVRRRVGGITHSLSSGRDILRYRYERVVFWGMIVELSGREDLLEHKWKAIQRIK